MMFPTIKEVARELRWENENIRHINQEEDGSEEFIDCEVRLQVCEEGEWFIRVGDPCYDLDHRGYWGASTIPGNNRRFRSLEVAADLIEQTKEDYYSRED